MPTHQSLGGASDEDLLRRMVETHPERFDTSFWKLFDATVTPHLPPCPLILDVGCGPGLLLRDLGERYPGAQLYGYDVTPAMIAYGQQLSGPGAKPVMTLHDIVSERLPHADGAADLVSMSSILHVVDEPLLVLAEIRRVVRPGGIFLLNDWVRQPLDVYLAWRRDTMGETGPDASRRAFRLFPVHNKYTPEDWRWLLAAAGFRLVHEGELRASHRIFAAAPS